MHDDLNACPTILVINLERSPERWASVQQNFAQWGLNAVRVDAVDAKHVSADDLFAKYNQVENARRYFAPLKSSELACFLSHRECWEIMVRERLPYAVVLEDDVVFDSDPGHQLRELAKQISSEHRPMMVKLFSRRSVSGDVVCRIPGHEVVHPSLPPLGTQGQMLNLQSAEQLLASTQQIAMPIDVTLQHTWETGVSIQVLSPNLIREISGQLGGSTLAATQKPPFATRLYRELARPWFRFKLQCKSTWRRFLGRLV